MPEVQISELLVYVADDVPANRTLLQTILVRGGMSNVRLFEDGRALLDAVVDRSPDLILLDLRMPVLDGFAVLDWIRRHRTDDDYLPVIVLTAESGQDARRSALDAGANDYVTKPFDGGEILLRVRNLLRTRALHLALQSRNADLAGQVDTARDDLSKLEREWADVAVSLSQLESGETTEATAEAICDELSRISGLTSVMIVGIDAAGQALPLARQGGNDVRIGVNRAIPEALIGRWRGRVGHRPWVGPWEPAFGTPMQRMPSDEPTALAVIPFVNSKGLLGALTASTAMPDGTAYLTERLSILESFGAVASALLAPGILERQQRGAIRARLEEILERRSFSTVFQPVVELTSGAVVGYEALTRFADGVRPDHRFADADAVGLGIELEAATLAAAAGAASALPRDCWLSLNVSPDFLRDTPRLRRSLGDPSRIVVLEITEHVAIEDYVAFRASVSALGSNLRYAVDDAGAGFSSFRHILELRPNFVKLDLALVRGIDQDEIRQALVAGITYFARRSGCRLIAEGIETHAEQAMLQTLGVELGQGFLLGRPRPIEDQGPAGTRSALLPSRERVPISHPGDEVRPVTPS